MTDPYVWHSVEDLMDPWLSDRTTVLCYEDGALAATVEIEGRGGLIGNVRWRAKPKTFLQRLRGWIGL